MLTYIEKLRTRSKAVRMQVAFAGAVMVTAVISFAWMLSLPEQFVRLQTALQPDQEVAQPASRTFMEKLQIALGINAFPRLTPRDTAAEEPVTPATDQPQFRGAAEASATTTTSSPRVILLATTSPSSTTSTSTSQTD